jgi:hypothetical protein
MFCLFLSVKARFLIEDVTVYMRVKNETTGRYVVGAIQPSGGFDFIPIPGILEYATDMHNARFQAALGT